MHVVSSTHILSDVAVGGVRWYSSTEHSVIREQVLSENLVGALLSNSSSVHVVIKAHTGTAQSAVPVWYSVLVHSGTSVHTLFEVGVGSCEG